MALQFTVIALSLKVQVPYESLDRHLAASPAVVSEELAQAVLAYEAQHHLGYFASLDYYIEQQAMDDDLIAAVNNISWVVSDLARNEIRAKLRPVFSSIKFEAIQMLIHSLPAVRPSDPQVLARLMEHFDLTIVKLNLKATLIQKMADHAAAEKIASNLAHRWLKNSFVSVDVTGVKVVTG